MLKPKKALLAFALIAVLLLPAISGCSSSGGKPHLDPDNPVTITLWHYYNGAVLNAFESAVTEFNETVGMDQGIIVEILGYGNPNDLESAVMASAEGEIGTLPIPNIFFSYADTAYAAERMGLLADLSQYFSDDELSQYVPSYIEEGRIGQSSELKIFPVAKSTEVMLINETDWLPFAEEYNLTYDHIGTMEGLSRIAELYFDYSGGKAFFGRDSRANLFIIASKQFGTEIFGVENDVVSVNVDREIMRKIWDFYYVPYISGYYTSYGRFSSDDARVGDILAYVGSTASAAYFPSEVTTDRETYPVKAAVLPAPLFEGGSRVMVQQGAGMVVTNAGDKEEYACSVFIKWFTDIPININFASLSGYLPVKTEAKNYSLIKAMADDAGIMLNDVTDATLQLAIKEIGSSELYTSKAFDGGVAARAVLENHLQSKAISDREEVVAYIESGDTHAQAVARFNTEDNFNEWLTDITNELNSIVK